MLRFLMHFIFTFFWFCVFMVIMLTHYELIRIVFDNTEAYDAVKLNLLMGG